jgi:hypothetical protein
MCARCGTFVCDNCGGRRPTTDVRYCSYPCGCRNLTGTLVPTMHTEKMWRTHNEGELPRPYPYGTTACQGEWAPGFGHRTVPQPTYQGVPRPGPESDVTDMDSWRRGVDAALVWMREER